MLVAFSVWGDRLSYFSILLLPPRVVFFADGPLSCVVPSGLFDKPLNSRDHIIQLRFLCFSGLQSEYIPQDSDIET